MAAIATIPKELDIEDNQAHDIKEDITFDYAQRAQWLRAAVLGANDGLLSTASLMMGVGAGRKDVKSMVLTGVAGLVAGACSMAIGEFVYAYSQYDIEMSPINRNIKKNGNSDEFEAKKKDLPSPIKAVVGLLLHSRLGRLLALIGFGGLSAILGRAPMVKSTIRVLVGGWLAMVVTFGLTKVVDSAGFNYKKLRDFRVSEAEALDLESDEPMLINGLGSKQEFQTQKPLGDEVREKTSTTVTIPQPKSTSAKESGDDRLERDVCLLCVLDTDTYPPWNQENPTQMWNTPGTHAK
ncbi:vacuolar iron transporter homolog 4-like protein [Tanacetum coccineum]